MRRAPFAVLLVLVGFAILTGLSWMRRAHEQVPWRTDYAAAARESRETGKPMLLDFTAEWCGPCQDMRRTTWSDPAVAQALRGYVPVQIDLDTHADLASRFGVSAIPHMTVLNADGTVISAEEGELSPEQFREWLATVPPDTATHPATAAQ
ncbi:MAG TPA: thioredoxin family protein [Tepidisphaeraceae bacterium]|jgi:thiol:disulfide interchange protein